MTMPENQGRDPEMAAALRGALLIVAIGAALGIAYNAMGLAGRPKHGLAWHKHAEKLESLEALQAAPAGGEGATMTGDSEASVSVPGDAAAATVSAPAPPKSAASNGSKKDTASVHATGPAPKKGGKPTGSQPGAPAPKKSEAPAGSQAAAPAQKPAPASGAQAGTPALVAAPPPAAGAAATTSAAADVPVIPDVTGPLKLELATLKKLYAANAALVIDAREAADYAGGHISGALSLPYNDAMAEPERVKKLDPAGRPIVIYCSGGDCELSMDLAKLLVEAGKRRVLVYEGGFPEWQGAGLPVAKGPNP
jgi:rhodanese-related sulfurtransferase